MGRHYKVGLHLLLIPRRILNIASEFLRADSKTHALNVLTRKKRDFSFLHQLSAQGHTRKWHKERKKYGLKVPGGVLSKQTNMFTWSVPHQHAGCVVARTNKWLKSISFFIKHLQSWFIIIYKPATIFLYAVFFCGASVGVLFFVLWIVGKVWDRWQSRVPPDARVSSGEGQSPTRCEGHICEIRPDLKLFI